MSGALKSAPPEFYSVGRSATLNVESFVMSDGSILEVASKSTELSRPRRRYALTVLFLLYTLNFLDRQIVNILAEPIKRDLNLTDWQLGSRSEEHTSELQSLMRISYAVFCLKNKKEVHTQRTTIYYTTIKNT